MTAPDPVQPVSDEVAHRIVGALVSESLVQPADRARAVLVVSDILGGEPLKAPSVPTQATPRDALRRRLIEVLAYVGAGLVVSAVVLFAGGQWEVMGFGARLALLVVAAVVLGGAGLAVVRGSGRAVVDRRPETDIRRRLASVLFTGAGVTAAGIVAVVLDHLRLSDSGTVWALPFTAVVIMTLLGYVLAPSAVGQLGTAVGAVGALGVLLSSLRPSDEGVATGLTFLGLGALWAVVAERGWWREEAVARSIGCVLAFFGTQAIVVSGSSPTLGYGLCFLLGVAGFALYLERHAWPYLVLGVVALTVSVTEAAADWFEDSIGAAGMLLVAGVTLLVASLVAMRLRREASGTRD